MRIPFVFALAAVVAVGAASCSTSSAQQAKKQTASDTVATVGPKSITLAEVDDIAMQQPASSFGPLKLSQALFEARRLALENIIGNMLVEQEAKARGMDKVTLVDQEVSSKVTPPSDAEVVAWYQANQQRVQGAPIDQVRQPIRAFLVQERTQAARQAYLEKLKAKTPVKMMLEPPRQNAKAGDSPAKGPTGAPIEMIEFSDFQCPFCLRANPTVDQVLQTYGDKIHFVYRNYPLPNHPNARPAAEAAQCANEQGKFWPYHDRLFAQAGQLSDNDLKQSATQLGLDAPKFNACFDGHKYKAAVDADIQAGDDLGVSGTPAFFINGRSVTGAQPFETFKSLIDEELELKKGR